MGASLAELWIYPVKSLAGGSHDVAEVHRCGLAQDRRWMVVDAAGRFMTQREHPRMALLHAAIQEDVLTLRAPCRVPLTVTPGPAVASRVVSLWRDAVSVAECGAEAAAWLTAALGLPCRLVHLAETRARKLRADHARGEGEVVSLADGFPVLLASRASLADLNARLARPVKMSRFRPNLVIEGAPAWAEDTWRRLRIGTATFRVSKPCDRCIMTTIDQDTGERPEANEPLRTLGRFRRDTTGKIMFGQNLVPENAGEIHAGDIVTLTEIGPPNVTLKAAPALA